METLKLSTDEIDRHIALHKQVLAHLVRDFGAGAKQSQIYRETQSRVEYLEIVTAERSSPRR